MNFDIFKTYRWYKTSGFNKKGSVSEITYDYIQSAVDKELKARHLSKTLKGDADFYVNITVTTAMRVDVKIIRYIAGVGDGYRFNHDTGFQSNLSSEQVTDYTYYRDDTLNE